MTPGLLRLAAYWREHHSAIVDRICEATVAHAGPAYRLIDREELRTSIGNGAEIWQRMLETGDEAPMLRRASQLGQARAAARIEISEVMATSDIFREEIWRMMREHFGAAGWDADAVEQIERWLHAQRSGVAAAYGADLNTTVAQLSEREQALATQSELIRALSTPIVPIHAGVLVLPLVGLIDAARATQVVEAVLERIVTYQADLLIIDITGVPVVDTNVANHLLTMTRAIRLLGAQAILVGISAEIAQTVVQLGIDLENVVTMANLQAGIAYALDQLGYAIRPR